MKLTSKQVAEYTRQGGPQCPFCGSEDIEGGCMTSDGPRAYQEVTCNVCNRDWTDGYSLDSIGYGERDDDLDFDFHYPPEVDPAIVAALDDCQSVMDACAGQLSRGGYIGPDELQSVAEQLAEYAQRAREAVLEHCPIAIEE